MPRTLTEQAAAAKMQAGVRRWIEDASKHPDGRAFLARKAEWVRDQIAILGRDDIETPEHLTGLTVWDLMAAETDLGRASRGLTPLEREPFVQIVFGHWHEGRIVYFGAVSAIPGKHPPYGVMEGPRDDGEVFVTEDGRHLKLQMVGVAAGRDRRAA